MYAKIKRILLGLMPWGVILKNEFLLRKIFSLLFVGKSVSCNICERHYSRFIRVHINDKMCPRCGSLARHRRLWHILNNEIIINRYDKILDFSPSRMILKKLKHQFPNYLSSDYNNNNQVDRSYDITGLPEPANTFDWIICYHILEHIENDNKALSELYRVLKKDGHVIIQTPFKKGATYVNPGIISKEDRIIHFGQEDHVRIYSTNGLKERLESIGFNIEIHEYLEDADNVYGFSPREHVLIGSK